MTYEIRLKKRAAREIRKLPKEIRERVQDAIEALAEDPRPPDCVKLKKGLDLVEDLDAYRIRVGDYRIIYTVDDSIEIVIIFKVGDRKSIYN
jgi:mRNA interferase RelE/StbE